MAEYHYLSLGDELMKDVKLEVARIETESVETEWYSGLKLGRIYGPGYPDLLMWDTYDTNPEFVHYQRFFPAIYEAIAQLYLRINSHLCKVKLRQVMVNHLTAGSVIDKHKDSPPADMRFHLAVITNPRVEWWDEINGTTNMSAGIWCGPVNYSGVLHSMSNHGSSLRTHILADFYRL